jgi:hypothetical protein
MAAVSGYAAAALFAATFALAPARAQETGRPPHAIELAGRGCLNPKERRALVENGTVIRLAAALHAIKSRMSGALIRARLCRRHEAYVYVLTVLAHDGKVTRIVVDAVKGTLISER